MTTHGNIIISPGAEVWDHELKTARALVMSGDDVLFLKRSTFEYTPSADIEYKGLTWEIKSQRSSKPEKVVKTVREALHQSPNVIFDSQRVKNLSDKQIEAKLIEASAKLSSLKHLIFINKRREIITIV